MTPYRASTGRPPRPHRSATGQPLPWPRKPTCLLSTEAAPGHPAHEAILHHLQGGHGGTAAPAGQTRPRPRPRVVGGQAGHSQTDEDMSYSFRWLDSLFALSRGSSTLSQATPGLSQANRHLSHKVFSDCISVGDTERNRHCPCSVDVNLHGVDQAQACPGRLTTNTLFKAFLCVCSANIH